MYVCLCKGLKESDLQCRSAAERNSEEALAEALGLHDDDCCGLCARNIHKLVQLANAAPATSREEALDRVLAVRS